MTIGEALLYSALGVSVVFLALVLLMAIIKIMTAFTYKKAETPDAPARPAPAANAPKAPGSAGELKLYDTDERTAAMLMAIVADELQLPINELRFKSIKKVEE